MSSTGNSEFKGHDEVMSSGEISMVRTLLGLTQKELAHRLQVALRTVEAWERGINPAPAYLRMALQLLTIRAADERGDGAATTRKMRELCKRVGALPVNEA